jgi:hypothetical protein
MHTTHTTPAVQDTPVEPAGPVEPAAPAEPVRIPANYTTAKRLGNWTTGRRFQVRAHRGSVVLDLRSPQIPDGDIEIEADLDHAMVKLLLPDGARVDDWDLHRTGRGRIKDAGRPDPANGRRIVITGEMRHSEIRVHRGGIAVLSAMFSREFLADARQAHRENRMPTVADPAHTS